MPQRTIVCEWTRRFASRSRIAIRTHVRPPDARKNDPLKKDETKQQNKKRTADKHYLKRKALHDIYKICIALRLCVFA